jgi:excisionase family DNA binding protein
MFNEDTFEHKEILGRNHLLTVKELAEYCQCSELTIRRALKSGDLQGMKFGNNWRIQGQDARNWIASKIENNNQSEN